MRTFDYAFAFSLDNLIDDDAANDLATAIAPFEDLEELDLGGKDQGGEGNATKRVKYILQASVTKTVDQLKMKSFTE